MRRGVCPKNGGRRSRGNRVRQCALAFLIVPTVAFGVAWETWDSVDPMVLKICTVSLDFGYVSCAAIVVIYLRSAVKTDLGPFAGWFGEEGVRDCGFTHLLGYCSDHWDGGASDAGWIDLGDGR